MEIEKTVTQLNYSNIRERELYHQKDNVKNWHREDGPACIYRNSQGNIVEEHYWVNNRLHNEDGPAVIEYNNVGNIQYAMYWINNNNLTKEEWEEKYGWKKQLKNTPMEKIFLTSN